MYYVKIFLWKPRPRYEFFACDGGLTEEPDEAEVFEDSCAAVQGFRDAFRDGLLPRNVAHAVVWRGEPGDDVHRSAQIDIAKR